jgi:hypothetical protein
LFLEGEDNIIELPKNSVALGFDFGGIPLSLWGG